VKKKDFGIATVVAVMFLALDINEQFHIARAKPRSERSTQPVRKLLVQQRKPHQHHNGCETTNATGTQANVVLLFNNQPSS
jgi:hypothetical protein